MRRQLALLLLAVLTATACGAGPPDHVRIGVVAPLTGPRAAIGQQLSLGAEMAIADINAAGGLLGHDVELVLLDDADLASVPGQLADLAERAHVSAVIGPESPGVLLGSRSPLTRREVPALLASAFAGDLDEAASFVARTIPSADAQARALGRWLVEEREIDRAAILVADAVEGDLARPQIEDALRSEGVDVVATVSADGTAADLRPAVASLRDQTRQDGATGDLAVLLWGQPTAAARATVAVRELDWDVQVAVPASSFIGEFRTLAGAASEGVVLVFPFDWSWFSSDLVPWMIRYNSRFGLGLLSQLDTLVIDVPVIAIASYDAVRVVGEAVTAADSREPAAVAEALQTGTYEGLLSDYDLSEREAWSPEDLYVGRFHQFALTFDVDPRLDLEQQRTFWDAQVSLDLFAEGQTPPAIQAIIERILGERAQDPPVYAPPLPPPGIVGRP